MRKNLINTIILGLVGSCFPILLTTSSADGQLISQRSRRRPECNSQQILTAKSCAGDGLNSEELKLYTSVNEYRAQYGLPPIAFSPSLTLVANRHVQDLDKNIGRLTHGWSNCPYSSSNRRTYSCMWKAPQRLGTSYQGYGYENAFATSEGTANASEALESWMGSSPHNAVILNQDIWRDKKWKALGVGIYGGYAVLWFGEEADSEPIR